jgi:7-carboxy-7-deazaguanine synthase
MTSANLTEIFTSVDGEGIYAGQPATFIRVSGCNLSCSYCDTPQAREPREVVDVKGGARRVANPVSSDDLVSLVRNLAVAPVVVFTGGEPLLQAQFVAEAGARLRRLGLRMHLETNGTLADRLLAVKDVVDFVSMDVKLPSSQGGRDLWEVHRAFLKALAGKQAAVKVVVGTGADVGEVEGAAALLASVRPDLPLLLQPAFEGARPTVTGERLLELLAAARSRVRDVRLSIQMHKVLRLQ